MALITNTQSWDDTHYLMTFTVRVNIVNWDGVTITIDSPDSSCEFVSMPLWIIKCIRPFLIPTISDLVNL